MKGIKDCANNSRTESLCPCEFVDVMYNECASVHVGGCVRKRVCRIRTCASVQSRTKHPSTYCSRGSSCEGVSINSHEVCQKSQ